MTQADPEKVQIDRAERSERKNSLGPFLLFGFLVVGLGARYGVQLSSLLYSLESTITEMRVWGLVLSTLVASLWAILCLPGPIILGFIGTVFSHEPLIGLLIVWTADSVAEWVGFVTARYFGREQVIERIGDKPWFTWLEEQIEQRGVYAVFLVRMMPFFPNSVANYALGLTSLRFWPYFIASVLGSLPNLALYIFGTAGVVNLVKHGFREDINYAFAAGVLILTTILLLGLNAILKKRTKL